MEKLSLLYGSGTVVQVLSRSAIHGIFTGGRLVAELEDTSPEMIDSILSSRNLFYRT
jgi:hypothetical protein